MKPNYTAIINGLCFLAGIIALLVAYGWKALALLVLYAGWNALVHYRTMDRSEDTYGYD